MATPITQSKQVASSGEPKFPQRSIEAADELMQKRSPAGTSIPNGKPSQRAINDLIGKHRGEGNEEKAAKWQFRYDNIGTRKGAKKVLEAYTYKNLDPNVNRKAQIEAWSKHLESLPE
jgi:hypothetical protein